ncbi:MAG: hypothetical protein HKL80_08790, partial [Acidimicrobiales bacterium]|nr:hypothetical protein [Acidimicrobiales bacterium]
MPETNYPGSGKNQITIIGISSVKLEDLALNLKTKIQRCELIVGAKRLLDNPWIVSLGIAKKYYDDSFDGAIDAIANCPGQVVV